jgi:hypothetical protein
VLRSVVKVAVPSAAVLAVLDAGWAPSMTSVADMILRCFATLLAILEKL